MGSVNVPSLSGSRYFITFVDFYSKWKTVNTIHRKSESFGRFRQFHKYAESHTGKKVQGVQVHELADNEGRLRVIRSYNGGEYLSNSCKAYMAQTGIRHQLTVAYTP